MPGRFVQDVTKAPLLSALLLILPELLVIETGLFDNVITELGYEAYAERPHSLPWLPSCVKMPGNLAVNLGYFILGVHWLCYYGNLAPKTLSLRTVLSGSVFSWLSVLYSFIQGYRILYQSQASAALDQWITLTIFCHVMIWMIGVEECGNDGNHGKECNTVLLYAASFISYFLSLLLDTGFDLALAAHVLIVIVTAVRLQGKYGDVQSRAMFIKGLLCCAGFVILKVLDLPLAAYWTPNVVSGHFLSKVCDVGQMYYVVVLVNRWDENKIKSLKVE